MHSCPDCGQACYCNGDIDDIDFGESSPGYESCIHSLTEECESNWPDDDFYNPDEGDD